MLNLRAKRYIFTNKQKRGVMLIYAGIGSRETPVDIQELMSDLGEEMAKSGAILRSGAAKGADTAFEIGADRVRGLKEIYEPWIGFSKRAGAMPQKSNTEALALAATVHPAWDSLQDSAKKLHARNCYQVLGENLREPANLLICWTLDGCESKKERKRNTGGTATAIVLAESHAIPIFNLYRELSRQRLVDYLEQNGIQAPKSLKEYKNIGQRALF